MKLEEHVKVSAAMCDHESPMGRTTLATSIITTEDLRGSLPYLIPLGHGAAYKVMKYM